MSLMVIIAIASALCVITTFTDHIDETFREDHRNTAVQHTHHLLADALEDGWEMCDCPGSSSLIDRYFWDNHSLRSVSLENDLSLLKLREIVVRADLKYDIPQDLILDATSRDDPTRCLKKVITDHVSSHTYLDTQIVWTLPLLIRVCAFIFFICISY